MRPKNNHFSRNYGGEGEALATELLIKNVYTDIDFPVFL